MERDKLLKKLVSYLKKIKKIENSFGEFLICEQIGQGGTAIVYKANHNSLSGLFAIKFFLEDISINESSAFRRFKQTYFNIRLTNSDIFLPQLFYGEIEDSSFGRIAYTIMPLCDSTLKEKYQKENLESNEWIGLFNQIGSLIQRMHDLKIIHRDLKPENLFIQNGKILIGDCDISCYQDINYLKLVETKKNDRLGNRFFSAPEQNDSNIGNISERSDWFAFGQIMYWLLKKETVQGIEKINLPIPENIKYYNMVVNKLLQKKPEDRFYSFQEIEQFIQEKKESYIGEQEYKLRIKRKEQYLSEVTLFDEIVKKHTADYTFSDLCINEVESKNNKEDLFSFFSKNINKLNLWYNLGTANDRIEKIKYRKGKLVIDEYHILVNKVYVFHLSENPGGSLVVVTTKNEYPNDFSNKLDVNKCLYFYGKKQVSYEEYNNGYAEIKKKKRKLEETKCHYECHFSGEAIFFISPQFGLCNENLKIFEEIYNDVIKRKISRSAEEKYLFSKLKNCKRSRKINGQYENDLFMVEM